jgi:hypothetical protein
METKFWILKLTEQCAKDLSYGSIDSFIVEAKNEEDARKLAVEKIDPNCEEEKEFWRSILLSTCEPLILTGESRVVMEERFI